MSDILDWRGLYLDGTCGRATVNGRGANLSAAPVIAGKPIAQIDYLPSLNVMWIRRAWKESQRDIEAWEVADAEDILSRYWAERNA